jgi:uncharacterized protein (DUF433 family)
MMNWREHNAADPGVLAGTPVIRGTRLAVEYILGLLARGWTDQEITRNHHLTADQARACAAYARNGRLVAFPRKLFFWQIILCRALMTR